MASLGARRTRRASGGHPPAPDGGWVEHRLVEPGRVPRDAAEEAAARRALRHGTLVAVRPGGPGMRVPLLVAAERLRTAGGVVVHVVPWRGAVRQAAARYQDGLAATAVTRVAPVLASMSVAKRRAAWATAWVVCVTAEQALADARGGVADLGRCSLLVLEAADRALGSPVAADLLRTLRAARPRSLVLAVAPAGRGDRRRYQAIMDAVGVRQLEVVGASGGPGPPAPPAAPGAAEPVEVEFPADYERAREALEAELGARVERLVGAGVMPPSDARWVTPAALVEAAGRARSGRGGVDGRTADALRVQAQALLLTEAITRLEAQGAPSAAAFLGRIGAAPDAARSERALARSEGLARAARLVREAAERPTPKAVALAARVRDAQRDRPGGRVVVVARDTETAAALARSLAAGAPGGGAPAGGGVRVLTGAEVDAKALAGGPLVVFHEVSSYLDARGHAAAAALARAVVLVTRGSREEAALSGGSAHAAGAARGAPAAAARAGPPGGAQVLIDEFSGSRARPAGRRRP